MESHLWLALSLSITGSLSASGQDGADPVRPPAEVIDPTYRLGDFDGDGLVDVYAVDPHGSDQLFRNLGNGQFENVTAAHGLSGIRGSSTALWLDFDGDRALDLYVASAKGRSKLLQNTGQGMFVDVTVISGLDHEGGELCAWVIDYDGDKLPDLHVATEQGDLLFHNRGRGNFERAALPSISRGGVGSDLGTAVGKDSIDELGEAADRSGVRTVRDLDGVGAVTRGPGDPRRSAARDPSATAGSSGAAPATPGGPHNPQTAMLACAPDVDDQATANCISASSVPTLGMLYPLSSNLFVDASGKVGMGTTSPSAKLHVAGVDGLLATGTFNSGTLLASGAGTRLMWYPRKAAFRAGEVTGGQWDDANIGPYSTALGRSTSATGNASVAMGTFTTASFTASTAMGNLTTASADISTAMGYDTDALGVASTSMGISTIAGSRASVALGSWNVGGGSPTSWVSTDPLFEIGNSEFGTPRSNAMTVLKNGSTGVGTTAPDGRLHVHNGSAGTVTAATNSVLTIENGTSNFVSLLSPDANERGFLFGDPLSNVDGALIYNSSSVPNGLDLRTNGNVTRMVVNSSGKVGVGTTSPSAELHVAGVDGLLATGTIGSGTLPASGAGTRLMWYPRKGAFRAGIVDGGQWDDANIGSGSVALGIHTTASGSGSTAMGASTTASGITSTALGESTLASGMRSTAIGNGSVAGSYAATAVGSYNVGGGSPTTWVSTDPLFEIGNSAIGAPRSNAMMVLKNGNTGVGTAAPDSRLHVHNGSAGTVTAFTNSVLTIENAASNFVSLLSPDASERGFLFGDPLSNVDGAFTYNSPAVPNGLDLRTNGNVTRMVVNSSGKVGVGTTSPSAEMHVAGVDGLLATGTVSSGTIPTSGYGTRMMWYPRKAAFRAGFVSGGQWDDANIGYYSVALGTHTTASGSGSTAMGASTTATGPNSTALGNSTLASGIQSTAMGNWTTASGTVSTAMGSLTTAGGAWSTAMGSATKADSYGGTALGSYNVGGGTPTAWITTDPLFEIGNSEFGLPRSNAMTVLKSGRTGIGTTAPDSRLHVENGSAGGVAAFTNSVLTIENATNNFVSLLSPDANERGFLFGEPSSNIAGSIIYNTPAVPDGLEFRTNGNQSRMSIDGSGRVGIGTTAPTDALDVRGRINVDYFDENTGTTANTLRFGGSGSDEAIGSRRDGLAGSYGLDFYTAGTRRMYIAGDGKVGIGRTPTTNLLEVEGNASKSSAGDWLANSDRRIKREIETIEGALDVIDRVRPVAFRYTEDYLAEHPLEDKVYFNVIAQEFAEVFPDYVQPSGEGDILQVDTYPMQVYAVAAVQELHRIVDEKDARIAALEERVAVAEVAATAAEIAATANDARIARLESALAALSTARQ